MKWANRARIQRTADLLPATDKSRGPHPSGRTADAVRASRPSYSVTIVSAVERELDEELMCTE